MSLIVSVVVSLAVKVIKPSTLPSSLSKIKFSRFSSPSTIAIDKIDAISRSMLLELTSVRVRSRSSAVLKRALLTIDSNITRVNFDDFLARKFASLRSGGSFAFPFGLPDFPDSKGVPY